MASLHSTIDYHVTRGEDWERLVMIKDRRTRRIRKPAQAAASILIDGLAYVIPCVISYEGGVMLQLEASETEWLEDGTYRWDMVAIVSRSNATLTSPWTETVTVSGNIIVSTYDNITPMESDTAPVVPLELVVV